jgi:hypothetical protein
MKRGWIIGIWIGGIGLLSTCNTGFVSISIHVNDTAIYSCASAEICLLSPAGGGYKFFCPIDGTQAYFIYDTDNPEDPYGVMERIWIHGLDADTPSGQQLTFFPLEPHTNLDHDPCPAENLSKLKGANPFPETFWGALSYGDHTIPLIEPCGTMVVSIKPAKP